MKYQVKVIEVYSVLLEVEADNREQAILLASDANDAGEYHDDREYPVSQYEYTTDVDDWTVEEIRQEASAI